MKALAELKAEPRKFFYSEPCQPHEDNVFNPDNIRKCQEYVTRIQRKLDAAVATGDKPKIRWYQHLLLKRSRAAQVLAVWRITKENHGKQTAGIDGMAIPKSTKMEQNKVRHRILNGININRKPMPIRRVFIPKPNGKLRPLGIPTLTDRVNQEIIKQAIEPICEFHFHDSSYGFRPKRCCQDAIADLFNKLAQKNSKQWIVDADIKGCFDNINHEWIGKVLRKWHVQENRVTTIHEMLKSKIFSDEKLMDNENGTPQGGVISPMLANVALTGFDENCHEKFGWNCNTKEGRYKVSPLVRYADDFIIISPTAKEAEHIKAEIDEHLKRNVGLRLSEEKTRIVNINEGFSFLGFNIRKDNNKLLIQPQVEKTQKVKQKLSETIRACKGASQATVIEKLNPIITGWGNYYRNAVSQETFDKVDYEIYLKLNQWTKKKHPNQTKAWSLRRYFHPVNGRKWVFKDKQNQKKLARMSEIPIKRHIKVKKGYRVYDKSEDAREYWEKREYMNAKESIYGSGEYLLLFKKQKGKCAQCKNPITQEHIQNVEIHKHHMKPRSTGGNRKISNLRLLHTECHQIIHSKWTRKEMAKMVDNGIDYLLLLKPQPTVTGIDGESRMR